MNSARALRFRRAPATILSGVCLCVAFLILTSLEANATGTPAGTAITNTATITYADGNANNFTATSNTVTTTVQDVATATIVASPPTGTTVPGGQYDAIYTVSNTGNGNGEFNLSFGTVTGADSTNATVAGYQAVFPTGTTVGTVPGACALGVTLTYLCTTSAGVVSLVGAAIVPENGALSLTLPTNVANGAAFGASGTDTVVTPVTTTVTYPAVNNGNATATTSTPAVSASETESVVADSRLDMTKSVLEPQVTGNLTPNLRYTVYVANGGNLPSRDLASVHALLGGATAAGILIADRVPTFNATPLVVQSVTTSLTGVTVAAGAAATMYYTSSATGAGPWTAYTTGAMPGGTTFVGVEISGGASGNELLANNNTTTEANVSSANAALTITLSIAPPTGTGSANANAVLNEANSVGGGNQLNPAPVTNVTNAAQNAIGPNVPANTTDSTTAIDSGTQGILYPTQAAGFTPSTFLLNGTSNSVGAQATLAAAVFDGPFGLPEGTGSYNGVVAVNNVDDFTAVAYLPGGFVPTNTSASAVVGNAVGATSSVTVANTLENLGNAVDSLALSLTAPTGWGVQIFNATTGGVITGGALAGTTSTNTANYTFPNVPSGVTGDTANKVNYAITYTLPATVTAFTVYDVVNAVVSVNNGTLNNTTHNDLIPGGPIAIIKTQTLDGGTCTGGLAVPGCIITYNSQYVNNSQVAGNCPGTASAVVPPFAGGYYAKGLTFTENGATGGNTWGLTYSTGGGNKNTTGLNAPATDTVITATTFTGNIAGSYLFTALVGGASTYVLGPGCAGNIRFAVTVNTL